MVPGTSHSPPPLAAFQLPGVVGSREDKRGASALPPPVQGSPGTVAVPGLGSEIHYWSMFSCVYCNSYVHMCENGNCLLCNFIACVCLWRIVAFCVCGA